MLQKNDNKINILLTPPFLTNYISFNALYFPFKL